MEAGFAELTRLVETGCQQAVAALRAAAARGGSVDELTGLLRVAFCQRNQLDAALSGVIAELDRAAAAAGPDGEATSGLSCASWLAHTLHINPGAAHAQVRLARQLPSLPATSEAFERGDLSAQHAWWWRGRSSRSGGAVATSRWRRTCCSGKPSSGILATCSAGA